MMALAFMFATSLSVVAQEKAANPTEKIESVEAPGRKIQTVTVKDRNGSEIKTKKRIATTNWYFQGTEQSQIFNPDFWDTVAPSEPCSSLSLTLPCLYETPIAMTDPEELIEHLEDEYGSDESAVAQNATTRKAESPN